MHLVNQSRIKHDVRASIRHKLPQLRNAGALRVPLNTNPRHRQGSTPAPLIRISGSGPRRQHLKAPTKSQHNSTVLNKVPEVRRLGLGDEVQHVLDGVGV